MSFHQNVLSMLFLSVLLSIDGKIKAFEKNSDSY